VFEIIGETGMRSRQEHQSVAGDWKSNEPLATDRERGRFSLGRRAVPSPRARLLDLVLAGHRGRLRVEPLVVSELNRRSSASVLRSLAGIVFGDAALEVGRVAGVERSVGTSST